ncbi:mannose-6-phosphate isomerase, class I [soil metagenome]
MQHIIGSIQHYPWGDREFIPDLLGQAADGQPWAELWLGTHPRGPAVLDDGRPLADVSGDLPYLFKVLAAAQPLSLQTHPDRDQARAGYHARKYVDPYPKPELLCALTRFEALCGVRPLDESVALLDELGAPAARLGAELRESGARGAIEALLRRRIGIDDIIEACADNDRPESAWAVRLAERYSDDPCVVVSLLLNFVRLEPGEALRLGPGTLHAYLGGAGVELMGASDNVVRAGLTNKPVDVDSVLDIMDATELMDPVLSETRSYPLTGTSIRLLRLVGPTEREATAHELVITTAGETGYLAPHDVLTVPAGTTAYLATS